MANKDQPKGFEPYGPCLRVRPYIAAAIIYPGDCVKQEAAGRVDVAAATNPLIGVAVSYASGAGETVLVADHPDQEFVGQAAAAAIDAQTDMGLNASIVVGTASTTYRRSAMEIDDSTLATTATLELKVLRVLPAIDNALGANCRCIVKINNHQLGSSTGTAGV